jgi:hypothetical protein
MRASTSVRSSWDEPTENMWEESTEPIWDAEDGGALALVDDLPTGSERVFHGPSFDALSVIALLVLVNLLVLAMWSLKLMWLAVKLGAS